MSEARGRRRLEQREMCAFLRSDLFERVPLPEGGGMMLWESPLGWQVLFDIPSARHREDAEYDDQQQIHLWVIEPDGRLYRFLPDTTTEELAEVLP